MMADRDLRGLGLGFGFVLLILAPAAAHHILGIPHYAYDEDYPQTPVLTYRFMAGSYEVQMTGYPGVPQAGERCDFHVYLRRPRGGGDPFERLFDGRVRLTILEDRLIGDDVAIYGPIDAEIDQGVFKFHPHFPDEANYFARIEFEAEGAPWIIDLPVVVGQPGSPWAVLVGCGIGVFGFLLVVRAIRIKLRRTSSASDLARRRP